SFVITILPTYDVTASATICDGATYVFGTQTLTTAGAYTEAFLSSGGCDSTVELTLDVITAFNVSISDAICEGDTFVFGSQLLTTAGTYTDTFQTADGCDSIVELTLIENPVYNTTDNAAICEGDTVFFG